MPCPSVFDVLRARAVYDLALGDYAPIRTAYAMELAGIIREYLFTDNVRVTRFKTAYKRAIVNAFGPAFDQGYTDGGGDVKEMEPDDTAWLNAKVEAEFGFADELFQGLKELKAAEGITHDDLEAEASRRAEGYARTLDGVYSEGKIRGAANTMLTFGGIDGQESCPECQRYKGQRHRASWWIKRGLIPGQPGNEAFTCRGYNCRHFLFTDQGEIYTA